MPIIGEFRHPFYLIFGYGYVAYQSVNGAAYPESKTVIFDAANATSETMKRRGLKKAE
ncbi:hypothetical protein [Bifidobacterium longum]|jgi:hypothetical protein|uniref:hypothetical protein n=1 Tax=Bifidobacterium longum TaxID=216816 RepID=UPI0019262D17|nr:hypothetical protein [Bifidobacterium longum]MBL3904685.1 hypothetical protein [Bifidobacterium longum subsp. longum]MBL3914122.1 hypothetical protein [Bifidobacterium longum subsp. longum]MDB6753027.1 hypothetical protein [Bifidobacterium longum]MDB6754980.1 hypothetical protein [Bifidobacterium longum]MDB6756786.1 hypothetical protein [Bifidobacterium longum]